MEDVWSEDYPKYDLQNLDFISNKVDIGNVSSVILSKFERSASDLIEEYPLNNEYPRKKYLFHIANNEEVEWLGLVKFTRFNEMKLPRYFHGRKLRVNHICQKNVFTYDRLEGYDDRKQRDWHVNFADTNLFGYYYGPLFAQDEMQAAEMPILASLSEFLKSEEVKKMDKPELCGKTRNGKLASPCLIRNAQRRISVSVDKNEAEGRPNGLYGTKFFHGSPEAIEKATHLFRNPELQNIIAMEAPKEGSGEYTIQTILYVLKTAFTGFLASRYETYDEIGENSIVCVHTGNWGTGAYAAELAEIDILVFHSFNNIEPYMKAKEILEKFLSISSKKKEVEEKEEEEEEESKVELMDFVKFVHEMKFKWGVSDGN